MFTRCDLLHEETDTCYPSKPLFHSVFEYKFIEIDNIQDFFSYSSWLSSDVKKSGITQHVHDGN